MVVNFEFLGDEPIENVITCMNFKVDKVVFLGYHDTIMEQKKSTESFLKKYCDVQSVVFHALSSHDLQSTLNTMRNAIEYELSMKNKIYFDITGGESLILVAFGMLCDEYDISMHMYDIIDDKLIEFADMKKMSAHVESRKIPLSLELLISMRGGTIGRSSHKYIKGCSDEDFLEDARKIYAIASRNWELWNPFSDFLRTKVILENDTSLVVSRTTKSIARAISMTKGRLDSTTELYDMLDRFAEGGILLDMHRTKDHIRFRFKSEDVKKCLCDGGAILEIHTWLEERGASDDCLVGVYLDWDGVIQQPGVTDVLNEVDVLSLHGNIATFISCKTGKLGAQQSLHALYEIETVASRFGGRYARKVLVSAQGLGETYRQRAAEMGIEVWEA